MFVTAPVSKTFLERMMAFQTGMRVGTKLRDGQTVGKMLPAPTRTRVMASVAMEPRAGGRVI